MTRIHPATPIPLRAAAVLAALIALTTVFTGCGREAGPASQAAALSGEELVARSRYLVDIGGCNDCHTPWRMGPNGPEPDLARLMMGHPADLTMPPAPDMGDGPWLWAGAATNTAFAGPWGVTYAPNLTPHESGLGVWTEEIFVRAMRTGKHMGAGRPIMPPMPTPNIGRMTDEDLRAVFAYLRSIPPLENAAPDWQPPATPAEG